MNWYANAWPKYPHQSIRTKVSAPALPLLHQPHSFLSVEKDSRHLTQYCIAVRCTVNSSCAPQCCSLMSCCSFLFVDEPHKCTSAINNIVATTYSGAKTGQHMPHASPPTKLMMIRAASGRAQAKAPLPYYSSSLSSLALLTSNGNNDSNIACKSSS